MNPQDWRALAMVLVPCALACGGGDAPAERSPSVLSVSYDAWTVSDAPVLPRGPQGSWDDGLVDPGAMIFHQGRFHMLYNGIRSWPSPLSVGHATSPDGVRWERQSDDPVFAPDPVPWGGWTVRATSVLVENDTWVLYFAVGQEGDLQGVIGRATGTGPSGPWTVDAEPVLTPGPPDTWDDAEVGHAKVLPDARGYVMYYTGWGDGPSKIGRATSHDGENWSRDAAPVLEGPADDPGSAAVEVSDPTVIRTADTGWLMVYRVTSGQDGVRLATATSSDGIAWTPGETVAELGSGGPFDMIYYSNVQATRTHQRVYFEARQPNSGDTDVWLASRGVRVGLP